MHKLIVQQRCFNCKRLLVAYGREVSKEWTCPVCKVEGATQADLYDELHRDAGKSYAIALYLLEMIGEKSWNSF